jgi:hypothetical protein
MVVLAGALVAADVDGHHTRARATSLEARLRATELALAAERSRRLETRMAESPRSESVARPASIDTPAMAPSPREQPIAAEGSRARLACVPERERAAHSEFTPAAIDPAAAALAAQASDAAAVRGTPVVDRVPASEPHVRSPLRPRLGPTPVYALSLVAGAGANALLHYDPDHGGYVDSWGTEDKWTHFALGALLAQSSMEMGVPARWSVPLTCAGAVGYEASQGYMSWRDATASCGGAAAAGCVLAVVPRSKTDHPSAGKPHASH